MILEVSTLTDLFSQHQILDLPLPPPKNSTKIDAPTVAFAPSPIFLSAPLTVPLLHRYEGKLKACSKRC